MRRSTLRSLEGAGARIRVPGRAPAPAVLVAAQGPAQHVYSSARAETADLPAPVFTIRGRVRLLVLELFAQGERGEVAVHVTTLRGGAVDLLAPRIQVNRTPDAGPLPLALRSAGRIPAGGLVLEGPGTVWAMDESAAGAHLWRADYWPLESGARLEAVE